jgi:hypothetical protein
VDEIRLVVAADDDDGDIPEDGRGLDPPGHFETVHVGHHVIHEDQVGPALLQAFQGLVAGFRHIHPDAQGLELPQHGQTSDLGVVHHERAQIMHRP